MAIEQDNGLSRLLRSAEVEALCGGFAFIEGPVWIAENDCLLFSDIPNNRIMRWRNGESSAGIYREPSQNSNGLTRDHEGNILACEHSGRRVSRAPYQAGGETTSAETAQSLAEEWAGRRLNSPNDLVVHSSGDIYFTDPSYGLRDAGRGGDLPHRGVYRVTAAGQVECLDTSFAQPNGLAFSPDETTLYVGDSEDRVIRRFSVNGEGTLEGGELFIDMRSDERDGPPDGMKVDRDGRLWTTGPAGIWVIEPDGRLLGILPCPEQAANIAFGGPELDTIYLTASTTLYRAETAVTGIAPQAPA